MLVLSFLCCQSFVLSCATRIGLSPAGKSNLTPLLEWMVPFTSLSRPVTFVQFLLHFFLSYTTPCAHSLLLLPSDCASRFQYPSVSNPFVPSLIMSPV